MVEPPSRPLSSSDRPDPAGGPRRTNAEREVSIDQAIDELQQLVSQATTRLHIAATQATPDAALAAPEELARTLGTAGDRVRTLMAEALPGSMRPLARDAERTLRSASQQLQASAHARTPSQARQALGEADRLMDRATEQLRAMRGAVRPGFVRGLAFVDASLDRGQARLFRILWFRLPPGSIARNPHFEALLLSRLFADIAMQALLYGALIATARSGDGALGAALVGTAYLLPGVVLGLYGGALADSLPKRIALGGAYLAMGLLCFGVVLVFGTGFVAVLVVLFGVRSLYQIAQPSEASTVPLVANADELAAANSILSLASSVGEVIGKAVLAPVLVRSGGVTPVVAAAGGFFWLATTRVFDLTPPREAEAAALRASPGASPRTSTLDAVGWLLGERDVLWMLLLAGIASTVGVVLGMLGPEYTSEVLDVDPANALYVFMPAAVGLVGALAAAPALIRRFGERSVAIAGFLVSSIAMASFGQIDIVTDVVRLVGSPGFLTLSDELVVAGAMSVPLGAGITLSAAATQTYVGRAVPAEIHGRTFAMLGVMKDGLSIIPLLVLGALAGLLGVRTLITVAPVVLLLVALAVAYVAGRLHTE